jgi:hypothetical protein
MGVPVGSVVLSMEALEEVTLDDKVAVLVASNELEDEIAHCVEEAVVDSNEVEDDIAYGFKEV